MDFDFSVIYLDMLDDAVVSSSILQLAEERGKGSNYWTHQIATRIAHFDEN